MENQKERDHNAMVIKGMRKLLDRSEAEKEPKDGSAWHGIVYSLMFMLVLSLLLIAGCFLSKPAYADDQCSDPGLSKENKKACVDLVKICKEIGCSVSVR